MYANATKKNLTAYVFRMLARFPTYSESRRKTLRSMAETLNTSCEERRRELAHDFAHMRDHGAVLSASCGDFDESPVEILVRNFGLGRSDARYAIEEITFRCKNGIL